MTPFSNPTPLPPAPNQGTKLPVPDVEGTPQEVVVSAAPDNSLATKKWLITTLIIAGAMAAAGLIIFVAYVIVSNTPGYMLSAAMQNLLNSDSEAGTISYQSNQGRTLASVQGDFLTYTDPTNSTAHSFTLSLGQDNTRVSSTIRLLHDGTYAQAAGLGNAGRLIDSMQGDSSALTPDRLVRLSSLDGQWYTFIADDVFDLRDVLPRQVQGAPTSADLDAIKQMYLKHPFLTISKHLGDEQIEGVNTMHLQLGFDQTKLGEFLRALKAANIKWLTLSDDDVKGLQSGVLFGLDKAIIDVWIARSERTFQQIRITRPQSNVASETLTVVFKSGLAAAQRQTVVRPEEAKSATAMVRGIQAILTSPSATPAAQ